MGYRPVNTLLHPIKVADSYAGVFQKAALALKDRAWDAYGPQDEWPEQAWGDLWRQLDGVLMEAIRKLSDDVAIRIIKSNDPDAIHKIIGDATAKLPVHWMTWMITGIQPSDECKPAFLGTWMHDFNDWVDGRVRDAPLSAMFQLLGTSEIMDYTGLTGDSAMTAKIGLGKISESQVPIVVVKDVDSGINHVWTIR